MTYVIQKKILIIGAGVSGLWLHSRLNRLGIPALLINKTTIGSGQTLSSQGIIHGGIKYSLTGVLSNSAQAIATMPARWRLCISGKGELNLSASKVLAEHQLMWSAPSIGAKVTGFFSSKAVSGKMVALDKQNYPDFFQQKEFSGSLYQLNEPVLDTHSLVNALSAPWRKRMLKIPEYSLKRTANGICLELPDGERIECGQLVLTAGEGNEALLHSLKLDSPAMQRRPLHMLLMKSPDLPMIYAHCVGTSSKPLVTISSHRHSDGDTVWYLGGKLAEDGVEQSEGELIDSGQALLNRLLPWLSLDGVQWASHRVNRAEPKQSGLVRPDTAFVESHDNIHVCWPTKLALAPALADQVLAAIEKSSGQSLDQLRSEEQSPNIEMESLLKRYPATIADPLWERVFP